MRPEDQPPALTSSESEAVGKDSENARTELRNETAANTPRADGVRAPSQGWVGRSLGKYRIEKVLGEGGMGVVLKATDPVIERDVAIKVLADHLVTNEMALQRFLAEARAAGRLNHPNVITIHEIAQEGPTHYLVLEYVGGGSLDDLVELQKPLSVLNATKAILDACKGVGAAHAAGMIHRDLKPANLLRAADGTIKVADFGLVRASGERERALTRTGMVVGTPDYMSPEQCEAQPIDPRSDVYSLGATYYCLLTGKPPYSETTTPSQVMYQHCHGPVPDPRASNPAVPEACARIVLRAMAKAPRDRYQSLAEMQADLQVVAETLSGRTVIDLPSESGTNRALASANRTDRPGSYKRRHVLGGAGLLVLVAATLAVLFWRPGQPGGQDTPGPSAVPPPSGEPVKIGVLHSLSGTMASSEAPVVDAVLFAVDEINQAGGVLGRPVQAVVADGRSDWRTFAREADRLVTEEKVCTVFGCWMSSSRKSVKPIFENRNHLLIYSVQFEGLETSPNIFYLGPAASQQLVPALRWATTSLGKKRFFHVGSDIVFPRAASEIIKDQLPGLEAQLVGDRILPLGSHQMDAVVAEIVRAKPDLILNTLNGDANVTFFRTLRAAGVRSAEVPTLSFSVGEEGLRSLDQSEVGGDYAAATYFQSVDTPENTEFVRRFHQKYAGRPITDPMETTYLGVRLWAQAVREAQSLEPVKIRRALLTQRILGPEGELRVDPDTQYCYQTLRIGQFQAAGPVKIVWTVSEPLPPEPYPSTRSAEAWRAFLHDLFVRNGNQWAAPAAGAPPGKQP